MSDRHLSTLRCVTCVEIIPQGPFVVFGNGNGPYHNECYGLSVAPTAPEDDAKAG